jgi:ubiquinone/menaquinone biosynthesis C-methylase UbiE
MARSAAHLNSITTSAGHAMSSAKWIDAHYVACQAEYEGMLRSVGLQSGWHVLDAGCGTGGFLPLMAELVGQHGKISAIDIAHEHIGVVRAEAESNRFACSVDALVGDITALSFEDRTCDAVWSANVAQYLSEAELSEALTEFRRVLKPGGVLAIKDGDITALQIFPIPPTLLWRLLDAWSRSGDREIIGLLGSLKIKRRMQALGFEHVRREVTFIERAAPLRAAESQFVSGLVEFFAKLAPKLELAQSDIEFWRDFGNVKSPQFILNHKDLYLREAAVLVIGNKPSVP